MKKLKNVVVITTHVTTDQFEAFKNIKEKHHIMASVLIRSALDEYLKKEFPNEYMPCSYAKINDSIYKDNI